METIRDDADGAELHLLHRFYHCIQPPPPPPPGPGPGRYALPPTVGFINHDFTKPSSPAYSFRSRTSSASKFLQELVARWKWNVCVMLCSDYSSDTKHQRPTQPWLHSALHSNQGFTHLFGKQCFGPKEIKTIQNYSFEKKKNFFENIDCGFSSGFRGLQPWTEVLCSRQAYPVWTDGDSFVLHVRQRKTRRK